MTQRSLVGACLALLIGCGDDAPDRKKDVPPAARELACDSPAAGSRFAVCGSWGRAPGIAAKADFAVGGEIVKTPTTGKRFSVSSGSLGRD